jgi:[protein-PII] uridylyltransferase
MGSGPAYNHGVDSTNTIAKSFSQGRRELFASFEDGDSAGFEENHTRILDSYFRESYAQSAIGQKLGMHGKPYAIIALGGYGRCEQCYHSDVDLLFLFEKKVPPEVEILVQDIVYPLWDLGLEIGHATRSISECVSLAAQDLEVITSLLDARLICGMSPLFLTLMERLYRKAVNRKPERLVAKLIENNRARHRRFGDSSYLLEPNLKEGQGGLRDYHTMLWIARIKAGIRIRRDLEYYGFVSHTEYQTLVKAIKFIWYVRSHLHALTGRKSDQLHLEHQAKLAETMDVRGENGTLPVEKLLGDLHGHMEFVKQRHLMFLYELEQQKKLRRKNRFLKNTDVPGLKFNRGMLNFTSPEAILREPALLMKIFLESVLQRAPLNAEAKRLVKDFNHLVGEDFRKDPKIRGDFEKILIKPAKPFNALNEMLHTGLIESYIPEFKGVVNRIQFDRYHLYPVARHLLRTVRFLKEFGSKEGKLADPLCGEVYREIRNKKILLWAALLHDIGKGLPEKGHSHRGALMVRSILEAKKLSPKEIDTIEFLVEEHLLMAKAATRRDIDDEETAIIVANRIKSVQRLKMLYLLTVADSMATGPNAWNDWKSILMRSLFIKVLNLLKQGELTNQRAVQKVKHKKEELLRAAMGPQERRELEELFKVMSPRYLLYVPENEISGHVNLFYRLKEKPFVWRIEKAPGSGTRTVTISAKDRPGLISKIAGVFTLNSIDILDVRIFTWRNNTALDIFEVHPPPDKLREDERWERAEKNLTAALAGELDLDKALDEKKTVFDRGRPHITARPNEVVVDNSSSSFFTIVEVYTYDFPGLLYRISNALYRCGLDIWVAKIATKVDQVVDVFYVRDFDGRKVDDQEDVESIKKTIIGSLPEQLQL